jgi:type 1 fimbriae regulatory protein FimB
LPWLFVSERGTQMTRQNVNYLIACIARQAGQPHVNPHMLRHSTGYYLADTATDLRTIHDSRGCGGSEA